MLIFTSDNVAKGGFELAIARRSPGTYLLILARAYGMAETRVYAVLNSSTPSSTVPASSPTGHPLIWLDTDLDRDPRHLGPPEGVLAALMAADSQVVRPTGRVQRMHGKEGGERDAHEVELMLEEDQLARCCWYCNILETDVDARDNTRLQRCSGEGYTSTYMCQQVRRFFSHWVWSSSDARSPPVRKQIRVREGRLRLPTLFLVNGMCSALYFRSSGYQYLRAMCPARCVSYAFGPCSTIGSNLQTTTVWRP